MGTPPNPSIDREVTPIHLEMPPPRKTMAWDHAWHRRWSGPLDKTLGSGNFPSSRPQEVTSSHSVETHSPTSPGSWLDWSRFQVPQLHPLPQVHGSEEWVSVLRAEQKGMNQTPVRSTGSWRSPREILELLLDEDGVAPQPGWAGKV